ncbi:hypothetical protein F5B19DRAFT_365408 [Rostrohypoxylon terebratum]|nr:hypothetical protein F5B19DRAFT_365408 [Rostrohypoxylon terebratum]
MKIYVIFLRAPLLKMAPLIKTLPASWYCSKPLYELEKSSVFLKSWYLLGPITKFADGNPVEYEFAGVGLVVETVGQDFRVVRLRDVRANGNSECVSQKH